MRKIQQFKFDQRRRLDIFSKGRNCGSSTIQSLIATEYCLVVHENFDNWNFFLMIYKIMFNFFLVKTSLSEKSPDKESCTCQNILPEPLIIMIIQ